MTLSLLLMDCSIINEILNESRSNAIGESLPFSSKMGTPPKTVARQVPQHTAKHVK